MSQYNTNPRFVWLIGAIAENLSDCPDTDTLPKGTHLWDRQEQKIAVTVTPEYAQAICLENTTMPKEPFCQEGGTPFTALEWWFNLPDYQGAFEIEGIPPTRPEYHPS